MIALTCIILFCLLVFIPNNKGNYVYKEVCIKGHVYYSYKGLAPKLTDDGKPCKCDTIK